MTKAQTLVLHSGTFKTGSTAVQRFLANNTDALHAADVAFAKAGRQGGGAQHTNLIADLRGTPAFAAKFGGWDDLFAEIRESGIDQTVISTEWFSDLSDTDLVKLGRLCDQAGIRLVWVFYVREQASFLNALYVERLITMRPEYADRVVRPFEEFRDWSPVSLDFLYYSRFADRILDAIPGVDLRVRPFTRSLLVGGNVVDDFFATLGVEVEGDTGFQANVGAGWRTVEVAKWLTPLLRHAMLARKRADDVTPATGRLRRISRVRGDLLHASKLQGWNEESAVYCTPEFREQVQRDYSDDNRRLSKYAHVDFAEAFANERPKPVNLGLLEEIPTAELTEVLSYVLPTVISPKGQPRRER